MEKLRIGVIGFGTVGAGVVETIYKNAQLMGERTGVMPEVTRIADLDTTIMFATAGTLNREGAETFADHR